LLDAYLAQEGLKVEDLTGICLFGYEFDSPLIVVRPTAAYLVQELGMFKKRVEYNKLFDPARAAEVFRFQEGPNKREPGILVHDFEGKEVFSRKWQPPYESHEPELMEWQRERFAALIAEARDA
jgi:hypothetical protein